MDSKIHQGKKDKSRKGGSCKIRSQGRGRERERKQDESIILCMKRIRVEYIYSSGRTIHQQMTEFMM